MTALQALPDGFTRTRDALHRVATHVLTPARYRVTGRIGLRATAGGFGTPEFDGGRQVRVEGTDLVVESGADRAVTPLTTLSAAAQAALGGPPNLAWASELELHDPPPPADPDEPLSVDQASAAALAAWFSLAWTALETLAGDPASIDASEPQLWPEHFDPAIEAGSDEARRRAAYGFSPGDGAIEEPYVYVSLWYADDAPASTLWNADSFAGAVLRRSEFETEGDPLAVALAWLRERRDLLSG